MATASVPNTFTNGATAVSAEVDANNDALVDFANDSVLHLDGTKTMTDRLTLDDSDPTAANHAVRKLYADGPYVEMVSDGTTVTYAAETLTAVPFFTAVDDVGGLYNILTRGIIVPKAGVWYAAWCCSSFAGSTGEHRMGFRVFADGLGSATRTFTGPQVVPNELITTESPKLTMAAALRVGEGSIIQPTIRTSDAVTRDFAGWFTATWLHG